MDKYFKSQPYSQDVVATLFTEDTVREICECFGNEFMKLENSAIPNIDTEQWKCLLTIEYAIKTIGTRIIPKIDTLEMASENADKINISAIKMSQSIKNDFADKTFTDLKFIKKILETPKYIQILSKLYNLTPEQENEFIECIKNDEDDIKDERLSCLTNDENFIRDLTVLIQAAMLDCLFEEFVSNSIDIDVFTKTVLIAKACVEKFPEEYQLWEASTTNKNEQYLFILERIHVTKLDAVEVAYLSIAAMFFAYFSVFTEQGRCYLFETTLRSVCNTPVKTALFIEFLKTFKFGPDFCNAYKKYLEEKGSTPVFNPDILIPVAMPLELNFDTNKDHENWFISIPRKKFLRDSPKDIFDSLCKLYSALRKENLIDYNTSLDLFVYRFSGLLKPVGPESTMKWTSEKNKLAILINLLYNDNVSKIPYAKVARFFGIEKSNFSQSYKMSEAKDTIYIGEILEYCGFKQLRG